MTDNVPMVLSRNEHTLLLVRLEENYNRANNPVGFDVILRNIRENDDTVVQSFPAHSVGSASLYAAYQAAYHWGYRLAGLIECDFQDLPGYSDLVEE